MYKIFHDQYIHERMFSDPEGIKALTARSLVWRALNWATETGKCNLHTILFLNCNVGHQLKTKIKNDATYQRLLQGLYDLDVENSDHLIIWLFM